MGAPAPKHGVARITVAIPMRTEAAPKRPPVVVPLRLDANTTIGASEFTLAGVAPWHPDPVIWSYFAHVVASILAALLTMYMPCSLLVLMVIAFAIWPVLLLTGRSSWGVAPGHFEWCLLLVQHLLAVAAAALPLACIIWRKAELTRALGFGTLLILEVSMLWTLGYPPVNSDWIGQASGLTMLSLCLTLLVRMCVLYFGDINPFVVERTTVVLCPGCSLSWAICYTAWSAVWAAGHTGPGATLADILLWVVMFLFHALDAQKVRIENYFAVAHGISFCTWVGLNRWIGLAQPFRDAEDTSLRQNSYCLFVSVMNFVYSFYVMYWEIYTIMRPEQGSITQLMRQKSFQSQQSIQSQQSVQSVQEHD